MKGIVDLDRHDEPYVSIAQLAVFWNVSDDTVRREIDKGALAAIRVGRQFRVTIAEARRYAQSGPPQE